MEPVLLSSENYPPPAEVVLVWSRTEGVGLAMRLIGMYDGAFEWLHKRVCGERIVWDVVYYMHLPNPLNVPERISRAAV